MAGKTVAEADTRRRILDAAERLFAMRGFDGTATSLIARSAGVPKGLLFYYFPSKLDLLSTLLGERLAQAWLDPAVLSVPGNPVRALLNVSERLSRAQDESGVLRVIVWREEHVYPEVRKALTRYRNALHETIEQVLQASLVVPVATGALRAAASTWAAIVTARPLESTRDVIGGRIGAMHAMENLRSMAELICSGLRALPALP